MQLVFHCSSTTVYSLSEGSGFAVSVIAAAFAGVEFDT
jgi:uncharacterized membrane protein YedE/YeeE